MTAKYERIRNLREDADLTQAQMGEKINVPQRTYAYYESGERMVPPQVLAALAQSAAGYYSAPVKNYTYNALIYPGNKP